MSMHEVNWRLSSIYKRKNEDASFIAGVHGVKLKGSSQNNAELNLTKDQEKKLDEAMEARMRSYGRQKL